MATKAVARLFLCYQISSTATTMTSILGVDRQRIRNVWNMSMGRPRREREQSLLDNFEHTIGNYELSLLEVLLNHTFDPQNVQAHNDFLIATEAGNFNGPGSAGRNPVTPGSADRNRSNERVAPLSHIVYFQRRKFATNSDGSTWTKLGKATRKNTRCNPTARFIYSINGSIIPVPSAGEAAGYDIGSLWDKVFDGLPVSSSDDDFIVRPEQAVPVDALRNAALARRQRKIKGMICDFDDEERAAEALRIIDNHHGKDTQVISTLFGALTAHYPQIKVGNGEISGEEMARVLGLELHFMTIYGRVKPPDLGTNMDAFILKFAKTYQIFPGLQFFKTTDAARRVDKSKFPWLREPNP